MINTITVDLDFDHNDNRTYFEFFTWVAGYDVRVEHFEAEGPAGGNPCITFRGEPDALRALINNPWYGGDWRDHRELSDDCTSDSTHPWE